MKDIIKSSVIGAFFFGLFSYFSSMFDKHPQYLKIGAFLWASSPLLFLYMIYITKSNDSRTLLVFTKHAIIGMLISLMAYFITLLLFNYPIFYIISINIIVSVSLISSYFYFKLYNVI